jgi:hypothetical protein
VILSVGVHGHDVTDAHSADVIVIVPDKLLTVALLMTVEPSSNSILIWLALDA